MELFVVALVFDNGVAILLLKLEAELLLTAEFEFTKGIFIFVVVLDIEIILVKRERLLACCALRGASDGAKLSRRLFEAVGFDKAGKILSSKDAKEFVFCFVEIS